MEFLSKKNQQAVAIQYRNESWTFSDLDKEVEALAKKLQSLPDAILCLTAKQHPTFIVQLLAAFLNNQPVAIFAPNWSYDEKQLKLAMLGKAIDLGEDNHINWESQEEAKHHLDTALILFTSGSTGKPKAVQLSKQNILANCHAVIDALNFAKAKDQLLFLPLSYSFGLLGQLLPAFMMGMRTELIDSFTDVKSILESNQVPGMWSGVPSHWYALCKIAAAFPESAKQLTHVISAGAPLHPNLRAELKTVFPNAVIYNNYGLTEASPRVLTFSSADVVFMQEGVGYPVGDWQVKLADDQELWVKGSQVMLGYLGEEDSGKIQEGWLRTGDLAEIAESGLVFIKGRRDHMVNVAGEKVNLDEVEHAIKKIPGVVEAAVVPVADALYGVRLAAFLEGNPQQLKTIVDNFSDMLRHLLSQREIPEFVYPIEILPRKKNGKLDRAELTSLAEAFIKQG